jgi:PAS domain S-box-containing protein
MKNGILRVLLAEDVAADAELCIDALKNAGFSVCAVVCSDEEEFERLVGATDYDVILADYNLIGWTGIQAVEIVQRLGKTIPVIVVTGLLGDEKAVDCLHQGAADYILKGQLGRLPSAVRRAISESMLREQSRLLAAAVGSVSEGVLIAEAAPELSKALILSLNESFTRITGYTSKELIGKQLGFFRSTENGAEFLPGYDATVTLQRFVTEAVEKHKDGSVYYAEWQVSPIQEGRGKIGHYVVIHRDITDRKLALAELAHTNEKLVLYSEGLTDAKYRAETATRAKSDFLARISHEIRTPMNAIIGMADVLSDTRLTEQQSRYVQVFQRAGENLLVLINQLLDLSKIESGKFDLEHINFDLNAILVKTISLFEVPAQAKGLSLSFHVAYNTPTHLVGDPHQLQQVLSNLIGNAIKFTETGSVSVEARLGEILSASDCTIQFQVTDTGVGIPTEKIGLIFEEFTQADSSTTRRYGGTGLGLAISQALVEKMNGNIIVESVVGAGSTLRFAATFGLQSSCPLAQTQSRARRILLCEDSADNAFLVSAYLAGTNYVLEHVTDGKQGLDRFEGGPFDVVLMDMQMPVMDGHAAVQRMRKWEADQGRRPTPILALTAHAHAEEAERCEVSGCTAFLSKPIRKAALLAALARHVPQNDFVQNQTELPTEVRELVPGYLNQKRMDLDRLSMAIEAADYATISTLGHQLKASGTSYGFEEFSEIGSALERSAKAHDLKEARRQTGLLSESVAEGLTVCSGS